MKFIEIMVKKRIDTCPNCGHTTEGEEGSSSTKNWGTMMGGIGGFLVGGPIGAVVGATGGRLVSSAGNAIVDRYSFHCPHCGHDWVHDYAKDDK